MKTIVPAASARTESRGKSSYRWRPSVRMGRHHAEIDCSTSRATRIGVDISGNKLAQIIVLCGGGAATTAQCVKKLSGFCTNLAEKSYLCLLKEGEGTHARQKKKVFLCFVLAKSYLCTIKEGEGTHARQKKIFLYCVLANSYLCIVKRKKRYDDGSNYQQNTRACDR